MPPLVLAAIVAIGIVAHASPPESAAVASSRVATASRVVTAAEASPPAPSSGVPSFVPVDRLNKFVIDDTVRHPAHQFLFLMREKFIPAPI